MKRSLGARFSKLFAAGVVTNVGDGMSTVAYPWLASAITRNPILIAAVAIAQRLPWLVFSLPAGVITDRVDRRRAMVSMDVIRGALTAIVALAVLGRQNGLPGPDEVDTVTGTRAGLYVVVVTATLLLGMAEVLRDNASQTIVPAIVEHDQLERANGKMWSAEVVANTFVGPPLGSLLLAVAFAVPFVIDSASFFVAAALVALIPGRFRESPEAPVDRAGASRPSWRAELREGFTWLWGHDLLRPMAIILGLLNAGSMMTGALFVLFAQDVLGLTPLFFTIVLAGGAVGAVIGGALADRLTRRLGPGRCLHLTLSTSALTALVIGLIPLWPVTLVMFLVTSLAGTVWNIITVSLRQSIIPSRLLGRVNSVYRFFGWGMMPVGAAIGGLIVAAVDVVASRTVALQAAWVVSAALFGALWLFGSAKLTTEAISAARDAAVAHQPPSHTSTPPVP